MGEFLGFLDFLTAEQWGAIGALSGVVGTLLALTLAIFGFVLGIRSRRERRYAKSVPRRLQTRIHPQQAKGL